MKSILDDPKTLPLDGEVQNALFKRLKSLDKGSKEYEDILNELTIHNVRLIVKFSRGLYDKNELDIDDVIAIGTPGLVKAIERFDLNMNVPFSSYAKTWIKTEIQRKAFEEYLSYHISIRDYNLLKSYFSCETRLLNERDGSVDREDVLLEMNLSNKQCEKLIDLLNISTISSLNSYYSDDEKIEYIDTIPSFDSSSNYYDSISKELNNDLQRDILFDKVLYGMTFTNISQEYNISVYDAKKLYSDAIDKLKNSNLKEELHYFISASQ